MTADSASRAACRAELASILDAALTGTVVEEVLSYPSDPVSKSPVIQLGSGGSARANSGINDQRWKNVFRFECMTFVRDADTENGWTEADVENALDAVDKEIADVIANNRVNSNWSYVGFSKDLSGDADMSEVLTDPTRGYKLEIRNIYVHYYEKG